MADKPDEKPQPMYKLSSAGSARAAIWLNTNQATQEEYLTVNFYRSYRDGNGEFKTTTSFRPQDIQGVIALAGQAQTIMERDLAARQEREQDQEPTPEADTGPEMER